MYGVDRSYSAGRFFSLVLEIVGLIIFVLGVFLAIQGFRTGGVFGMVGREFARANPPELLRMFSLLPGLAIAVLGAAFIVRGQTSKATLDQSVLMNDMLQLMKADATLHRKLNTRVSDQSEVRQI